MITEFSIEAEGSSQKKQKHKILEADKVLSDNNSSVDLISPFQYKLTQGSSRSPSENKENVHSPIKDEFPIKQTINSVTIQNNVFQDTNFDQTSLLTSNDLNILSPYRNTNDNK